MEAPVGRWRPFRATLPAPLEALAGAPGEFLLFTMIFAADHLRVDEQHTVFRTLEECGHIARDDDVNGLVAPAYEAICMADRINLYVFCPGDARLRMNADLVRMTGATHRPPRPRRRASRAGRWMTFAPPPASPFRSQPRRGRGLADRGRYRLAEEWHELEMSDGP